jgi:hypothetical protein
MSLERPNYVTQGLAKAVDFSAEISKTVDKALIVVGSGIYALISPVVGAALIVGSVLTFIPASELQKWAKNTKKQS